MGILSGEYPPGSSVASVRVLALEAGVNPNTMQKALAELETLGLLNTHRSSGRTVTEDEELIAEHKKKVASGYIETYLSGMAGIGFRKEEAVRLLASYKDGEDGNAPVTATSATTTTAATKTASQADGAANPENETTMDTLEVE